MTELWLVRHGQTDWNLEDRFIGQTDLPMNAAGFAQVEHLATRLDGRIFRALYSSDLLRTRQTAEILSRQLGLPVQFDARLREIDQGEWEGEMFSMVAERYADVIAALRADPLHARPPGGETLAEMAERLWAALDDIAGSYPGEAVMVVSHGLALATVVARVQGVPLDRAHELIPENADPLIVGWPPTAHPDLERGA